LFTVITANKAQKFFHEISGSFRSAQKLSRLETAFVHVVKSVVLWSSVKGKSLANSK